MHEGIYNNGATGYQIYMNAREILVKEQLPQHYQKAIFQIPLTAQFLLELVCLFGRKEEMDGDHRPGRALGMASTELYTAAWCRKLP